MPILRVLTPEFDAFRIQFEQPADEADRLAGAFTEEQFMWRLAPDNWSVVSPLSSAFTGHRKHPLSPQTTSI
jgi:hypothetical protein